MYACLAEKKTGKARDKKTYELQKEMIVEYLTDKASAKTAEIASLLRVSPRRARAIVSKLKAEDLIVADGADRCRTYRLKS